MATVLTKPDEREENELVPWLLLSTHNFSVRYLYYFTLRMKATLPLQIRLTRNLQFHEILIYYFDHFILKKVLFLLLCFFCGRILIFINRPPIYNRGHECFATYILVDKKKEP